MSTTATGTAPVQASLWGRRAKDWAEIQEPAQAGLYPPVLDALALPQGARLLDVGCGSGVFAAEAAARGLDVTGLDATPELVEIARQRVPARRFDVGELEALPYDDDAFHAVTSNNAFQYAASPVAAVREAARVTKPGGTILAVVWGRPEDCEAAPYIAALGSLLPPPPPGAPGPFALSVDGALQTLFDEAGVEPVRTGEIGSAWSYPDQATMLRGLLAAGPSVRAIDAAGEDAVAEAVRAALAPYGTRIENRWRYVIGRV
jgi:SAM-dependent methyltransferase